MNKENMGFIDSLERTIKHHPNADLSQDSLVVEEFRLKMMELLCKEIMTLQTRLLGHMEKEGIR